MKPKQARQRRWPGRRALPVAVAVAVCVVLLAASRARSSWRRSVHAASAGQGSSATLPGGCFNAQHPATPGQRVLVTGAAGFIGYHTSKALATQQPGSVFLLGLDNFNSLYNPALKAIRQARLSSCCNVSIVHGDIRNLTLLEQLFGCYQFTHVVHLAAHAGVRQSAAQPAQYASSNVEGTVVLLEAVRRQQQRPAPSLVYASSSSVYGMPQRSSCGSSKSFCCQPGGAGAGSPDTIASAQHLSGSCWYGSGPHSHWQGTAAAPAGQAQARKLTAFRKASNISEDSFDPDAGRRCLAGLGVRPSRECEAACAEPTSVYASTKLATEAVVAAYVHQYGLAATGLRFFTVYGSLGRPDMAVTAFTRKLLAQEPISILCFPAQRPSPSSQQPSQPHLPVGHTLQPGPAVEQQQEHTAVTTAGGLMVTKQALAALLGGASRRQFGVPAPPRGCVPAFRDFTAVEDVVSGITAALNSTTAAAAAAAAAAVGGPAGMHRVLNLGRGQPQSVLVLLQQLQQLLGAQAQVQYNVAKAGAADVWVTWADTSTAERQLGVNASISLNRGLREFVDWYLSDTEWTRQL